MLAVILEVRHKNHNNNKFRPVSNSENGETSSNFFHYKQNGNIEMRFHQINDKGELMTGICTSKPKRLSNGKLRLHENWKWTSGDKSKGQSIIEEI